MKLLRFALPLLFLSGVTAKKPPPEPDCIQWMCFSDLKWTSAGQVTGLMENHFGVAVPDVQMEWGAYGGYVLSGTAQASISVLPANGVWAFVLYPPDPGPDRVITSLRPMTLRYGGRLIDLSSALPRVCNWRVNKKC
jgi:hypothetical protein